jgi:hypothetical protein
MVSISPEWRRAIAKQWLELTLCAYPSQSMNFLLHETDCFRNPVGQTHKDAIPMLVDEIFGHMDSAKVRQALEDIVRIRAVQNFSAKEAVGFIFLLKEILQKELSADRPIPSDIDRRIDEIALVAFDLYSRCREQISAIQVREARNRVALLERMFSEVEGR